MTTTMTESPAWNMFTAGSSSLQSYGRPPAPMGVGAARALPAFARGVSVISGMGKQMPLDAYKGVQPLSRPSLLDSPDPDRGLPWFIDMHMQDYIINGNAVHLVTSRNSEGWPASVMWVPAQWVTVIFDPSRDTLPTYWCGGTELPREDVVHVQRGADPWCPWRGVGVVEQHVTSLARVADQEVYESEVMRNAAVPSVVITAPNKELMQSTIDAAQAAWKAKYAGPTREPAVLPAGTTVTPLSWSPHDSQMIEARQLSHLDIANLLNLDGLWVGSQSAPMTYKSAAPMYLNLLRQSVNPILVDFEALWSARWLPRGTRLRFGRQAVLEDDLASSIAAVSMAVKNKIWSLEEGRTYLGMPPQFPEGHTSPGGQLEPLEIPGEDVPSVTSPVTTTGGES